MNEQALAQVDAALDTIRPEAKEYAESLDAVSIPTTKDNYGRVLSFLSSLQKDAGEVAPLFLIALVGEGYPLETAQQLNSLLGWPSSVHELLTREADRTVAA